MREAGRIELPGEDAVQFTTRPAVGLRWPPSDAAIRAATSGVLIAVALALGVDALAGGDALSWLRAQAAGSNAWVVAQEHPYGR